MAYQSSWMTPELSVFRDQFRRFLSAELAPKAAGWRRAKMVDRDAWRALGRIGALLPSVPEPYGGGGTFAFEAAVIEDISALDAGPGDRRQRAQRDRRPLHPQLRLG